MANKNIDTLFQLISSLEKSEKRNFKLYITRNSGNEDLKIIELFDAIDKLNEYDETALLKKLTSIKKPQLSNIKAHLYKQLLASLRLIKIHDNIDIQLHEQLDFARILYNKGLYLQSLKILDKIKEMAISYNQDSFLIQIISLEKKIETLYITRSMHDRAGQLTNEALEVHEKRGVITRYSNLALLMYSYYVKHGHARNEKEIAAINIFFKEHLPQDSNNHKGFYEQLYLYQSYCWYGFILQDFLKYYKYTQKWVNLFHKETNMINFETAHYIKGVHNLLNAHYILKNNDKFNTTLEQFREFAASDLVKNHENNRIQSFIYVTSGRLNQHLMQGTFDEGLLLVPEIEQKMNELELFLDRHRVLVFNYKIANLYFGNGDFEKSIDYLRKIINGDIDLRIDLQYYARLLHLLAHFELGNFELIEHLIKSLYRFMAKMNNMTLLEEEMFSLLRKLFHLSPKKLKPELELFLVRIKQFEGSRFEKKAFAYFDIISWIESKVYEKPMDEIIRDKFMKSRRDLRHKKKVVKIKKGL